MALSGLFPKGFFDKTSEKQAPPTPPASEPLASTSSSTSSDPDELLPGRDKDGKLKLPRVALYVSGASFFLTIGLTATVVYYVQKSKRKTGYAPEFISQSMANRRLRTGWVRSSHATSTDKALPSFIGSQLASRAKTLPPLPSLPSAQKPTDTTLAPVDPTIDVPDEQADPSLLRSRRFNALEERELYGEPAKKDEEDEEEYWKNFSALDEKANPSMAFNAFAIATAAVGLSAGLGLWVTAKLLGVSNMDDFVVTLRGKLVEKMPVLAGVLEEAKRADETHVGEDGTVGNVWGQFSKLILEEKVAQSTPEEEKRI